MGEPLLFSISALGSFLCVVAPPIISETGDTYDESNWQVSPYISALSLQQTLINVYSLTKQQQTTVQTKGAEISLHTKGMAHKISHHHHMHVW